MEALVVFTPPPRRSGGGPDEHKNDHEQDGVIGQKPNIHRVEAGRAGNHGLKKDSKNLVPDGQPVEDVIPLENIDEYRAPQDQNSGRNENDPGVHRKPSLPPSKLGEDLMLDHKADPPRHD
jgi:hypothetical protein